MADMYITGEPAGNWETAVGNSALTEYEVDVTGIDDMDLLEQYMHDHVGAIPYEMVNGQKVYVRFAKLPQNNTAVTIQGITSLVQGTAGYLTGYTGEGFWMKVGKGAVLNAIMQTMYLVIGANEVAQSVIGDLDSRLDDFCIVGTDDVPVYVDSNGVAYVMQDAIEALRQELITLGAYSTGGEEFEPLEPTGTDINYYSFTSREQVSGTLTTITDANYERVFDNIKIYRASEIPITYQNVSYTGMWLENRSTGTAYYPDYAMVIPTSNNRVKIALVFNIVDSNIPWEATVYNFKLASDKQFSYGSVTFEATNANNVYPDYVISTDISLPNVNTPDMYGLTQLTSGSILVGAMRAWFGLLTMHSVTPIPGITASDVVPVGFGDASLPLGDVVPGWALRGKDVSMPDEDNIWAKNPVLPLDVPLDDVWTDGYAGDSADTYDGDLADILKDALVDVLPDILDDIIENTDVTEADVYDIPAGDTGDTPPAEPPVLNGSSNGLWTMYNPTKQQVNEFGAWLWSDTLIDQIIRQFNSPIDAVIGFHQIYCTPITGSAKIIKAGFLDSPVSAAEVTNQYATIDCGQVSVDEYYGNALDYDNTQVSIFLPFVGIVPLNTNVVMGSVLHVIYRIDVFTGTCLAQVKVIKANSNAVMYAFEGNCAVQIPLTGTTYTGMVGALLGGLSASVSFMAGDMYHGAMGALSAISAAGSGLTGVKQSGNMGANAGSLGIRIPYLIITRSASAMPAGFENLRGIPSTELVTLGSLSGFTSVRDVHLEGIPATAEEINEIKELLSEGVIL